jgi:hypothetical protein
MSSFFLLARIIPVFFLQKNQLAKGMLEVGQLNIVK